MLKRSDMRRALVIELLAPYAPRFCFLSLKGQVQLHPAVFQISG